MWEWSGVFCRTQSLFLRAACLMLILFGGVALEMQAQNPDDAARAGAVVADSGLWAAQLNPASAINSQRFDVALGYRNYFFIPELHAANLSLVKQVRRNALLVNIAISNGYPAWTMQQCNLGYAVRLFPFLRAGLQLGLNRTVMSGIAPEHSLGACAGVMYLPCNYLSVGLTYKHQSNATISPADRVIYIGAQSSYFERLKISAVYIVYLQMYNRASVAFSYSFHKKMAANLGFSSGSKPLSYGMSFYFGKWSSILAFEHHLQLGVQPTIGILYSF